MDLLPASSTNSGTRIHQIFSVTGAVRYAFSMSAVLNSRLLRDARVKEIITVYLDTILA